MKKIYLITVLFLLQNSIFSQTTLVNTGSSWKYLDNGSDQGTSWIAPSFNETSWLQGNAQLGYGDSDEATVVSYGSSATNKYVTTYFRKTFSITDASLFLNYTLNVKRDDGVAVYVNGVEVYRNNLTAGATYTTLATLASDDAATFQTVTLPAGTFVTGNNTIAVEIHQNAGSSSDISFDLGLIGNTTAPPVYTQNVRWGTTKNSLEGLTVSWSNASTATTDKIKWGYTAAYENGTTDLVLRAGYDATIKFYSFTFPGVLNANATLYYSIYNSVTGLWSSQKTFNTSPPVNTNTFKFAAVGDSRTNVNVWNTVSNLVHAKNPDFIVFNGDIIDSGNSASQWQSWFTNGDNLISNNLILHSQGNHDVATAPYYQNIFDLPKNNPQNTELYYSVDYGEAIFINLNSEDAGNLNQLAWLQSTLAANVTKKWKIVSFHKPFYTVGPHANEMNAYFSTWYKAFDDYGVDLILTGHDHMYERFKPINRNVSTTNPVAVYGSQPTEGRCQVVCGGAGAPLYSVSTSSLLQTAVSTYHYVIFDVTSATLCGTAYSDTNTIIDNFCIDKTTLSADSQSKIFYPISVSPNPASDYINVKYTSPNFGDMNITVYDFNGKLVDTFKTDKNAELFNYRYDVSKLKGGVYVFEILMNGHKDNIVFIRK